VQVEFNYVFPDLEMEFEFNYLSVNGVTLYGVAPAAPAPPPAPSGDGIINGFDMFILLSAYFRSGVYSSLGNTADSAVTTVSGRANLPTHCEPDAYYDWQSTLEWNKRIGFDACYERFDEADYQASLSGSSRRLSESSSGGLDAKLSMRSPYTPGKGYWMTVHLPRPVVSVELLVAGLEDATYVPLDYAPAPLVGQAGVPEDADRFQMRFERHLELAGKDTNKCAVVCASGLVDMALHRGMISVSQRGSLGTEERICAFNLVVWVPAEARPHPLQPGGMYAIATGGAEQSISFWDPIWTRLGPKRGAAFPFRRLGDADASNWPRMRIVAGSVAMDGRKGLLQAQDAYINDVTDGYPEPEPLLLPPPPPKDDDGLSVGASIGIGIGIACLVLGVSACILCCWVKKCCGFRDEESGHGTATKPPGASAASAASAPLLTFNAANFKVVPSERHPLMRDYRR